MKAPRNTDASVSVAEIHLSHLDMCIIGISPLVPHAMSFKARGALFMPAGKKTQTEKETTLKHEPYEEFRDACYLLDGDEHDTAIYMPGTSFHSALADVAIDMTGAKKAQIGRLTSIPVEKVPVWGVPKIWSTLVRSSNIGRTPDVRILPILPKWATFVTVDFVASLIKAQSISNLMGAAGQVIGIGDGRPQKGKLTMGRFRLCDRDDPEFLAIVKSGGREAQRAALATPIAYDIETERLLRWFDQEIDQRHAAPPKQQPKRRNGGDAVATV